MTGGRVTTLSVLGLTHLGLGWYAGFHSFSAYLAFWLLCGLVAITALRTTRRMFPWAGLSDAIVRTGILSFALIVLAGLTLGSVGLIGTMPYLVFFAALLVASLVLDAQRGTSSPPDVRRDTTRGALARVPLSIPALLLPLLAFVVAVGILQSPLTLYDSLSYHLFFPVRWLQDHRLSTIPTPFSDPAQAYQPGNGELFFLWLMLPFHGDLVARMGQLPFLLLGGVSLYAIARRIGARPEHAVYAPAFYFLARPAVEQAVGADVDLICAATFVTSLYLGLVALDTDQRRDWILCGVSLGLYGGSKYLALVYTPVFLLLALVRGPRLKMLWALPGIVLLALPWYLRNWMIAGSPIYPATLKVAGITIARGAFTREAMNNTIFHTSNFRLFPVMASHAFGGPLLLFWMPFALLGAASILTRHRWWPGAYVLIVPLLMVPLYWFGLPANVDSRFLLPAVAVATVPFAFSFGTNARWNACMHGAYLVGMLWILIGVNLDIPLSLPWYMDGWQSLTGLVGHSAFVVFAGVAGVTGILWRSVARSPDRRIPLMAAIAGMASAGITLGSDLWCAPYRCALLQLSSPSIRSTMILGWDWVRRNTREATLAYTGNNVPYPLFGERLTNRVYYVNIDRHASWRFHNYARTRSAPGATLPSSPLARSSGELMPLSPDAGLHGDASRPRYERLEGHAEAWIQNLKSLGIDHLFISALSAYEIDYVWHNESGFPIEDEWARADPQAFKIVYENPQVRIYAISQP
jgi:hypothetical protein